MRQRTKLALNAGNLLELAGSACGVYGVYRLAGFGWALVLAGVLCVAAAELIYDEHVWRLTLPARPQPRRWVEERRQALGLWWLRRKARRARPYRAG